MLKAKEAEKKLCPIMPGTNFCVSCDCMAWQWIDTEALIGRCMLIPKNREKVI